MLDFSTLTLEPAEKGRNAFVGLLLRKGSPVLRLPRGFEPLVAKTLEMAPAERYPVVMRLYFTLYSALRTFAARASASSGTWIQDYLAPSWSRLGERQVQSQTKKTTQPTVIFSSLDRLFAILHLRDEPYLLNYIKHHSIAATDDWRHLPQNLHRAIYLPDGTAMMGHTTIPKAQIRACQSDLVRLCCFLATEVSAQSGEQINPAVTALSEQYRRDHLQSQETLFAYRSWHTTRARLCDHLEEINRAATVKDNTYRDFYEAADHFLNGTLETPTGEAWGITGFAPVWEAACAHELAKSQRRVVMAEPGSLSAYERNEIAGKQEHYKIIEAFVPLRPDSAWTDERGAGLSDAKYMQKPHQSPNIDDSLVKQYVYAWALRSALGVQNEVVNELWYPDSDDTSRRVKMDLPVDWVLAYLKDKRLSPRLSQLHKHCERICSADLGYPLYIKGVPFEIIGKNAERLLRAYGGGV